MKNICDVSLYDKKLHNGVCCPIKDKNQLELVKDFISSFSDMVFIKDNLELSVALSMNFEEDGQTRTKLGECEYQVKYHSAAGESVDKSSAEYKLLSESLMDALDKLPYYKYADYICAVPSNHKFVTDMISESCKWRKKNISACVSWRSKSADIKNAKDCISKLDMLDKSDFLLNGVDVRNKTVILVDDLYQSGVTMQYVAMKLKEAGASRVFGICLVKSLSF